MGLTDPQILCWILGLFPTSTMRQPFGMCDSFERAAIVAHPPCSECHATLDGPSLLRGLSAEKGVCHEDWVDAGYGRYGPFGGSSYTCPERGASFNGRSRPLSRCVEAGRNPTRHQLHS